MLRPTQVQFEYDSIQYSADESDTNHQVDPDGVTFPRQAASEGTQRQSSYFYRILKAIVAASQGRSDVLIRKKKSAKTGLERDLSSAESGDVTGDDEKEIRFTKSGSFDCRKVVVSLLSYMFRTYWGCYRPSAIVSLTLQYHLWSAAATLFEISGMFEEALHYHFLSLEDEIREREADGEEEEEGGEEEGRERRGDRVTRAMKREVWMCLEKYISKSKCIFGSVSAESLGIRCRLLLRIFAFCQKYGIFLFVR